MHLIIWESPHAPTLTRGIVSNTPFVQPFSTPSTGIRTRELHGAGYYHVGSPADPGYAESMRAMFGRDELDPHWEIDYRNLSEVCPIISDNFIGSDKFIGYLTIL